MIKNLRAIIFSAGILMGASSIAAPTDDHCSNAMLEGDYAFAVTTHSTPVGVVTGIKQYDGKGHFKQRDYRGDSLRVLGQTDFSAPGLEKGTYSVSPDCTGSEFSASRFLVCRKGEYGLCSRSAMAAAAFTKWSRNSFRLAPRSLCRPKRALRSGRCRRTGRPEDRGTRIAEGAAEKRLLVAFNKPPLTGALSTAKADQCRMVDKLVPGPPRIVAASFLWN